MAKAYVLLSGGLDSSTLLYRAVQEFNHSVCAISVYYGQRHKDAELKCAMQIALQAKIQDHQFIDLSQIMGKGGLTDEELVIPHKSYDELEGVSPTYVPFRNGLMLSALTSRAQADPEAEAVYYGAHAEDAENWAYPDCTPEFIGAMANAIYIGTYHRIRLHTPYMWCTKSDIVSEGILLGVPYQNTWSCYEGGRLHCGKCPTCRARHEAFIEAGVGDPTEYEEYPNTQARR